MTRFLIGAVLAFFSVCSAARAQGVACDDATCRSEVFVLHSASDANSYGMLATLPADAPCAVARIVALDMQNRRFGETDLLVPGAQGRIRLGQGFDAGLHPVRLMVSGCIARPIAVRRITMNKASPDHGWRAAAGA
jgi:hypothetical protein